MFDNLLKSQVLAFFVSILFMWGLASHAFYIFLKLLPLTFTQDAFLSTEEILSGYKCLSTIFCIRPAFTKILQYHQEKLLFWKSKTPSHLVEDALG